MLLDPSNCIGTSIREIFLNFIFFFKAFVNSLLHNLYYFMIYYYLCFVRCIVGLGMRQISTIQYRPVGIHVGRTHWKCVIWHARWQVRLFSSYYLQLLSRTNLENNSGRGEWKIINVRKKIYLYNTYFEIVKISFNCR